MGRDVPRRTAMNRTMVKWISVCLLFVGGCDFIKEHEKAAIGTGVGAGAGAIIGGLAAGRKGVIYGGLIGALAGGAIGAYLDYKDKDADQTNKDKNYTPDQGVRVDLESAKADPASVSPGGTVKIAMTYALMAPSNTQELEVTERRVILLNDKKLAEAQVTLSRVPGTYTSEVPIMLPADIAKGKYSFESTVSVNGKTKQINGSFMVE